MRWLADAVYLLAALVYLPVLLYQALFVGKNRRGWRQRLGGVPHFDPSRPRVWVHAVSLGEVNATPRLIEMLRERRPNVDVVVSTTTDTGFARAVALYGAERVFRFPLDFSPVVQRVLRRVRPSLIVLVELEVWFNLTHLATHRGIPVAVVNGRLTERSARQLHRLGRLARSMFQRLTWVGAQDEAIAARFRSLGVAPDRIDITSSVKWDTATVVDRVEGASELAHALGIPESGPVWVCGSTGPGEEAVILDAFARLLNSPSAIGASNDEPDRAGGSGAEVPTLVIVPRKPERFDEVARLISQRGFTCRRRSECPDGAAPGGRSETENRPVVILGDTMGELRKFYSLARVVFIGRSLVPMGGSDPMEVGALGRPMLCGPHMDNFAVPATAFQEAGALQIVRDAPAMADRVADLLHDGDKASALGVRARDVVTRHQGATEKTCARLLALLPPANLR